MSTSTRDRDTPRSCDLPLSDPPILAEPVGMLYREQYRPKRPVTGSRTGSKTGPLTLTMETG
jgi:hypothetical protein